MTRPFTVEESNLICIFETGERTRLINQLREAMTDMEPEMRDIAQTCIIGLEGITDEEYAIADFIADYDEFEDETEV